MFKGLPKRLKIGPYLYKIYVVKRIDKEDDCFGLHRHGLWIKLRKDNRNRVHAADTVLHEVFHAIYQNLATNKTTREEQVVGSFSTALTQVFLDNPKLVTWLTKALRAI